MSHVFRRALFSLIVSAVLLSSSVASSAPAWVRVETPNFVVFGEVGERRTREVAEQFERFREAMGRVLPAAATPAAVPTIAVVFESQKSFGPYRIRYNGKPVEQGGFFAATADHNLVALSLEHQEFAMRIIFHEYAHLVITNAARGLPAWLNEGLADYYSTFAIRDDGKSAVLGGAVPEYLQILAQSPLLSLDELFKVERDSPLYNEGSRRSIFYAQSWAIVHMLLTGEPDRSKELSQYSRATSSGVPSAEAWREAFPGLNVNGALKNHVTRRYLRAYAYRFARELPKVRGDVSNVSPADVQATLGDLLLRVAPSEEAQAHLQRATDLRPASLRAKAQLAQLRIEQGDYQGARALLIEASAATDWLASYTAAVGLTRLATLDGVAKDGKTIAAASKALDTVHVARPNLPYALAMRAQLGLLNGEDLEANIQAIRLARQQSPGREDFAFIEAQLLARHRDFAAARAALGPFMSWRNSADVRTYAKSVMTYVLELEKTARGLPAETPLTVGSGAATGATPIYREPGEGETKVEGLLQEIECSMRGVVLHVRVRDQVLQYAARAMGSIEFITYRTDQTGEIGCTTRVPPDKVFVTSRASDPDREPGFAGWVVAVEFLR